MKNTAQLQVSKATIIALAHLAIIAFAYSSVAWLDWRLVVAGVVLYYIQLLIFKGCILTIAQFGHARKGFIPHYLEKIFRIELPAKPTYIVMNFVLPVMFIIIAYLLQEVARINPLIHIS